MFITLQEDRVLVVYDSAEDAVADVEGLDAEATFVAAFDAEARPHSIEWLRPNERHGMAASSGVYRFRASGPPDVDALRSAVRDAAGIEPPSRRADVEALLRRLT